MPTIYGTPHTRAAWEKLPEAKRGFKSYDRYRRWWNSNIAPRFTVSDDPFAPIPMGAQKAIATETVQSQINPLIKAFEDSISRRSREGGRAISQATTNFERAVQPFGETLGSVYDTSSSNIKDVNQSLIDYAQQQGQNVSGLLAGMIPEKDAAGAVGAAQTLGAGIGGEALARGSASLAALAQARAADVGYAEKLPGYARAFGTQAQTEFQRGLNQERAAGMEDLRSRIPGLVTSTLDSMRREELDKAIARKGFELDADKLEAASQPEAPDYSWRGGPANRQWDIDPLTGEQYANPNYVPPSQRGAGGKLNTTGITQTGKIAAQLHEDMMSRFSTVSGTGLRINNPEYDVATARGRAARDAYVAQERTKASERVLASLKSYYPGKSENWIRQQAAAILYANGWRKAAADLMGVQYQQASAPAAAAAPTSAPPRSVRAPEPTATAAPKPAAPATQKGEAAREAGQSVVERKNEAAAQAAQRTELVRGAKRDARKIANFWKEQNKGQGPGSSVPRRSRSQVKAQVIKELQGRLKGHPYKKIIAMAEEIMDDTFGSFQYGNP